MYTDEGKGRDTGKFLVSSTGMLDCVSAQGSVGNQLFYTLLSSVRIQLSIFSENTAKIRKY